MEQKLRITNQYQENLQNLDSLLRVKDNFDVVNRAVRMADSQANFYFVDGFVKDDLMEKVMQFMMAMTKEQMDSLPTAQLFADYMIPYVEVDMQQDCDKIVTAVLSGTIALLVEKYDQVFLIDARTYPARSTSEPEDDKVLRGSHDGFVETLIFNTALIRRRIRSPMLTMEYVQVGSVSKTDIVMCYMADRAEEALVNKMREKLKKIKISSLTLNQESLAECIGRFQWLNPFPKVRYTERPDMAAASVQEGSVLILIDNSPSVMVLPCSFFDFIQETNDYYFPPMVGTYLRWVRAFVFFLTIFGIPVWYLLIKNPQWIPEGFTFLRLTESMALPVIAQLFIIEFMLDAIQLASLNTPSALSSSFSIVGALILGEFAVQSGWFAPQVVLYMAFVAVVSFVQSSFELGYAFKLFRMWILLLTSIFNVWGFVAGVLSLILVICITKPIGERGYLYPIIPFNGKALMHLLFRLPISRYNTRRGKESGQNMGSSS